MRTNTNYIYPIALLCVIMVLFSCHKKGESYPRKYVFDSYEIGKLYGFANAGPITTEIAIDHAISNDRNSFWTSSYTSNQWDFTISILSGSTAQFVYQDSTDNYNLRRFDGILCFESVDTITSSSIPERFAQLKYFLPYLDSTDLGGGLRQFRWTRGFYAIETSNGLFFPKTSFLEKHFLNSSANSSRSIGSINNVLNKDFINTITVPRATRDTFVYQENKVIFKQQ